LRCGLGWWIVKIALFDYSATPTNPVGGCHYRMIRELCREHEFTVFAVLFENPCPERIRWVRVPCPRRPLALLFLSFHILAPLFYLTHRWRHHVRFDIVQMVESNLTIGGVSHAQFCHRAYLRNHWKEAGFTGLRALLRWLDHRLHALVEPLVFRRVNHIVVPSAGLARELSVEYPFTASKIRVHANPVDLRRMRPPENFDRQATRRGLGLVPDDVVLDFVALGQYERKGLPLLMEAMALSIDAQVKLLVVGGTADLRKTYAARAARMGLERRVRFIQTQRDVRPFLWAADGFAFPSSYEAFPLVVLEAAAAGLPVIATQLSGVEEFLVDGRNGILIADRSVEGILQALTRFLRMLPQERNEMGRRAQQDIGRYDTSSFVAKWKQFYEELDPAPLGAEPMESGKHPGASPA
jgi:glycosyltransferase involved in cell wall biosynthesis